MGSVVIRVERKDQVNMLATNSSEGGKIFHILMEGYNKKIIDEKQKDALMEISRLELERR